MKDMHAKNRYSTLIEQIFLAKYRRLKAVGL